MPKSYYTISSNNDRFLLTENFTSVNITFEHGFYNSCNFPKILEGKLNANSPNSWHYVVRYNKITKKLDIRVYENGGIQPEFNFTGSYIGQQMGFLKDTVAPFVGDVLNSYYIVNFQKTQFISLVSNVCLNNGHLDPRADIVLRIPVSNVEDGSMITYQIANIIDGSRSTGSQISTVYHFKLIDDNGFPLEINTEWSFDIFYYKFNIYYQLKVLELEEGKRDKKLITSIEENQN